MRTADRAVLRLAVRELWHGVVAVVLGSVVMLQVIVSSYSAAFGTAMSGIQSLVDNPAVRALYGVAYDLNTAGGFAVWRAGSFVLVVAGLWAAFATVRVLRGEEDQGRWDLLLAEPVAAGHALGIHLAVLIGGCVLLGLAVAGVLLGAAQPASGSFLFGAGVALLAASAGSGGCAGRRRSAGSRRCRPSPATICCRCSRWCCCRRCSSSVRGGPTAAATSVPGSWPTTTGWRPAAVCSAGCCPSRGASDWVV